MKNSSALVACGLALACASGIARADVDAGSRRPPDARISDSSTTDRAAPGSNPGSGEATDDAGWPTQAKVCLGLAVVGAFILLGRRRGFD